MRLKTYKYRLYPTPNQKILLAKTFGCVRFVYNKSLDIKTSIYQKNKKSISVYELIKQISKWKKLEDLKWLKEVNSQSLQSSLQHLDIAFTKFFKEKRGFPKFKKKSNKQSFSNPQNTTIDFEGMKVFIPKFKEGIKAVFHRTFKGKIKTSTVSQISSGKYFISILVEEKTRNPKKKIPKENKTLGIDLGIKSFLTDSNGNKIDNPRFLNKYLFKLQKEQRRLSLKKKGSNNRNKQRIKVARIYEKISNCRKDFLHKVTTSIVKNQNYTSVAIEDLSISNMIRNRKLSRCISDVGWGMFKDFLSYKCDWYGKNLLIIGRFDPSSRLCTCGYYNKDLKLSDRNWECPVCNENHDRDILAAKNIKRFAICKQDTYPSEQGKFTPVESCVGDSLNQEAAQL